MIDKTYEDRQPMGKKFLQWIHIFIRKFYLGRRSILCRPPALWNGHLKSEGSGCVRMAEERWLNMGEALVQQWKNVA